MPESVKDRCTKSRFNRIRVGLKPSRNSNGAVSAARFNRIRVGLKLGEASPFYESDFRF